VFLLTGCVPGSNPAVSVVDTAGKTYGFWSGLWHGFISPVTFIISLFNHNVNIYEVHNSGNWYNFGFMLGISMIFGGSGAAAKRKRKLV
jgi:ABC-type multidrug transport system permease subunit